MNHSQTLPHSPGCRTFAVGGVSHSAGASAVLSLEDPAAFAAFVREHRPDVLNYLTCFLRNAEDAEEVTQDAFLRLRRSLATFRGNCSLKTWLYTIAKRAAINRYHFNVRRGWGFKVSLDAPASPDLPESGTLGDLLPAENSDFRAHVDISESEDAIERARGRITDCHREILSLRVDQHRSYDEIAALLGIKAGTVKSRLARARRHLRAQLPADTIAA